MNAAELERVREDAHDGVFACSRCGARVLFPSALTVWHGGVPIFGLCARCMDTHSIAIAATEAAIRIVVRAAATGRSS